MSIETYLVKEGCRVNGRYVEAGETVAEHPRAVKYQVFAGQLEKVSLKRPSKASEATPSATAGDDVAERSKPAKRKD